MSEIIISPAALYAIGYNAIGMSSRLLVSLVDSNDDGGVLSEEDIDYLKYLISLVSSNSYSMIFVVLHLNTTFYHSRDPLAKGVVPLVLSYGTLMGLTALVGGPIPRKGIVMATSICGLAAGIIVVKK